MSYTSYERFERARRPAPRRRGALSYWLPLAATVTIATIGIAAWIWSERNDDDDEDDARPDNGSVYDRPPPANGNGNGNGQGRVAVGPPSSATGPPSYAGDLRPGETGYGTVPAGNGMPGAPAPPQQPPPPRVEESQGYIARMSGALQRAPSPQEFIGGASRSVAAGVAAAGAAIGTALSSIREEDRNAYGDHKTWSEEAESRKTSVPHTPLDQQPIQMRDATGAVTAPVMQSKGNGVKRTVAIVISAESDEDAFGDEDGGFHQHASILSHIPKSTDLSAIRLFILIYAPGLKEHPLDASQQSQAQPTSLASSYSNIGHDQAQTPTEKPSLDDAPPMFKAVYSQALSLVEKDTMVLPFTSANGHVHMLRHLAPDLIYLQESLAGDNGEVITHLQTWLRQDVVLVVGAEGGHGGLADSESEAEQVQEKMQWWKQEERVGLGRGVVVVEGVRVGDDWARRVERKE